MFQFAPLLWGAGLGALSSLAMGKDPLKGALVGGATGGLLGGLPAGAWAGGAAEAAKTGLATGAGSAAAGTGVTLGNIASSSALPTALQGSSMATGIGSGVSSGIGGTGVNFGANLASSSPYTGFSSGITNELGANMAFNPNSGLGMPTMSSAVGQGSIDNLAQYSTGVGTDLMAKTPTMFDQISPYLNVRDLTGAAQVASQFQPRQQQMQAPSGRVSEGRAPQGTDVTALLQSIKQPERRRITLL